MPNDDFEDMESEQGTPEACWECGKPPVIREYGFDGVWFWSCEDCTLGGSEDLCEDLSCCCDCDYDCDCCDNLEDEEDFLT